MQTALSRNLDLRQAQARIREARSLREAAAGGQWPALDARAGITREEQTLNGPLPIREIPGLARDITIYDAEFDASWELDLFGRVRRQVESAQAQAQAAEEQARDARVSVAAEVARTYLTLRGAQLELEARSRGGGGPGPDPGHRPDPGRGRGRVPGGRGAGPGPVPGRRRRPARAARPGPGRRPGAGRAAGRAARERGRIGRHAARGLGPRPHPGGRPGRPPAPAPRRPGRGAPAGRHHRRRGRGPGRVVPQAQHRRRGRLPVPQGDRAVHPAQPDALGVAADLLADLPGRHHPGRDPRRRGPPGAGRRRLREGRAGRPGRRRAGPGHLPPGPGDGPGPGRRAGHRPPRIPPCGVAPPGRRRPRGRPAPGRRPGAGRRGRPGPGRTAAAVDLVALFKALGGGWGAA